MRYHVFSLVAVFLALAIGMLLGTTLIERGLIAEQRAEIRSLKQTFDDIKAKNSELNDNLKAYTRYAEESKPFMVANMLSGRTFAVLTNFSPDERTLGGITEALAAAGATVPMTVLIGDSSAYTEEAVGNLSGLFQLEGGPQEMKQRVFAELAAHVMSGTNPEILASMQQAGVIKVRGSLAAPVNGAILMGPVEVDDMDKTDTPLISNFTPVGFPIVGVAAGSEDGGVLVAYKKRGISTVDHVDTAPGEVALAMVLSGRPGNYGSGKAATRMLPPP